MTAKNKVGEENQSVRRALGVLDLLAATATPMGVREIARRLGLSSSIAQRLVVTLANAGYIEQSGTNSRYSIGYKAFQTGNAFVMQNNLHSVVMPELNTLAEQNITGFLAVLRGSTVVYLATVQGSGPITVKAQPGTVTHLHSTALGKALLAEFSDEEVKKILTDSPPKLTEQTITSIPRLLEELAIVRQLGYATNNQENRLGVYSAGAVIHDVNNNVVAALSGSVPISTLNEREEHKIIDLVVAAAQRVSRQLGAPL